MIYSILANVILLASVIFLFRYKRSDKLLKALITDKKMLETQLKEAKLDLGIAIKHAKESRQRTIKSKKDLADAKKEVFDKYNYTDINSAMEYINGTE